MTGLLHGVEYNVEIACAIIYAVCIFYSCVGGIKAVIWTDAFQALCMFGSYLGIIVYGRWVVLLCCHQTCKRCLTMFGSRFL